MASDDVDKILAQEAIQLEKDKEIDRILSAFKLNPYDVLDLDPGCAEKDIKITYRKKSLQIHPDKTKNPKAVDAFDLLKKAETELMDEHKRADIDQTIADARRILIREDRLDTSDPLLSTYEFKLRIRAKAKEILINEELRRRRARALASKAQGEEEKKIDEEAEKRKRKLEEQKKWEDSRDERVHGWRQFQKGPTKKKKKPKLEVLG